MTETEDAFDLFGTSTVRVHKETEEEKRSRQLAEKREALGLAPVPKEVFYSHYFDPAAFYTSRGPALEDTRKWLGKLLDEKFYNAVFGASPLYSFKGLDLASIKSDYSVIYTDEMTYKAVSDWRYYALLPRWKREPNVVLVPLPKYLPSTAEFIPPKITLTNKLRPTDTLTRVLSPEPAWLKFQRKY